MMISSTSATSANTALLAKRKDGMMSIAESHKSVLSGLRARLNVLFYFSQSHYEQIARALFAPNSLRVSSVAAMTPPTAAALVLSKAQHVHLEKLFDKIHAAFAHTIENVPNVVRTNATSMTMNTGDDQEPSVANTSHIPLHTPRERTRFASLVHLLRLFGFEFTAADLEGTLPSRSTKEEPPTLAVPLRYCSFVASLMYSEEIYFEHAVELYAQLLVDRVALRSARQYVMTATEKEAAAAGGTKSARSVRSGTPTPGTRVPSPTSERSSSIHMQCLRQFGPVSDQDERTLISMLKAMPVPLFDGGSTAVVNMLSPRSDSLQSAAPLTLDPLASTSPSKKMPAAAKSGSRGRGGRGKAAPAPQARRVSMTGKARTLAPPSKKDDVPFAFHFDANERELLHRLWGYHLTKLSKDMSRNWGPLDAPTSRATMVQAFEEQCRTFGTTSLAWSHIKLLIPKHVFGVPYTEDVVRQLSGKPTAGICDAALFSELCRRLDKFYGLWLGYHIASESFDLRVVDAATRRFALTLDVFKYTCREICSLDPESVLPEEYAVTLFPQDHMSYFVTLCELVYLILQLRTITSSYSAACESSNILHLLCLVKDYNPTTATNVFSSISVSESMGVDQRAPVDHGVPFEMFLCGALALQRSGYVGLCLRKSSVVNQQLKRDLPKNRTVGSVVEYIIKHFIATVTPFVSVCTSWESELRLSYIVECVAEHIGGVQHMTEAISDLQVEKIVHFMATLGHRISKQSMLHIHKRKLAVRMLLQAPEKRRFFLPMYTLPKLIAEYFPPSTPRALSEDTWRRSVFQLPSEEEVHKEEEDNAGTAPTSLFYAHFVELSQAFPPKDVDSDLFGTVMHRWLSPLSLPHPHSFNYVMCPTMDYFTILVTHVKASLVYKTTPKYGDVLETLRDASAWTHTYTQRLKMFLTTLGAGGSTVDSKDFGAFLIDIEVLHSQRPALMSLALWYSYDFRTKPVSSLTHSECERTLQRFLDLFDVVTSDKFVRHIVATSDGVMQDVKCFEADTKGVAWRGTGVSIDEDKEAWLRVLNHLDLPVNHTLFRFVPIPTQMDAAFLWFAVSHALQEVALGRNGQIRWLLSLHDTTQLPQSLTAIQSTSQGKHVTHNKHGATSGTNNTSTASSSSSDGGAVQKMVEIMEEELALSSGVGTTPWNALMSALYTSYLGTPTVAAAEDVFRRYDKEDYNVLRKDFYPLGEIAEKSFLKLCMEVTQQPLLSLAHLRPLMFVGEFHIMAAYRPGWERVLGERYQDVKSGRYTVRRYTLGMFRLIFPVLQLCRGPLEEAKEMIEMVVDRFMHAMSPIM